MKIGERFIQECFGNKLEYEVDRINDDGTVGTHLVRVIGQEEPEPVQKNFLDDIEVPSDVADTPVESVEAPKPKTTTTRKRTTSTKTTTTRKRTTTKK